VGEDQQRQTRSVVRWSAGTEVVEKNGGALIEERIYLGGFEIFRRRNGVGSVTLERETLHVMDDKQRIALVETRTQGNDGSPSQLVRYQFSNHLSSDCWNWMTRGKSFLTRSITLTVARHIKQDEAQRK
jgi:hypothetical protein